MPFKKELFDNKSVIQVGNHFELSRSYKDEFAWKFKKITATRLCGVLGLSKFETPFKMWCQMVNIFEEKMDPIVSKVGTVIEDKVRKFINEQMIEKTGINFKYSYYDTKTVQYDCWKKIDDVFGGIPDGEPYFELPPNNNQDTSKLIYNKGLPLLEIKTSSVDSFKYAKDELLQNRLQLNPDGSPIVKELGTKRLDWYDNKGKVHIPEGYIYQICLYMYLRNINKGMLACTFVDTKNYTNPDNHIVTCDNTIAQTITLKPQDFEPKIKQAREWYYKYVKIGISPEMNEIDKKWLEEQLKLIK